MQMNREEFLALPANTSDGNPTPAAVVSKPVKPNGAWRIRTKKSTFKDTKDVYLSVESNETLPARFGQRNKAQLGLRCQENTTALTIHFGGHHMTDIQGYGSVDYRIDDGKAGVWRMDESTSNEALGLWSGGRSIPQIKKMIGGDVLYIRATPFNENPMEMSFKISGLDNAITELRKNCSW